MGKMVIDRSLAPTDEDNEDNAVDSGLRAKLNAQEQRLECSATHFYLIFMSVFASKADLSAAKVRLNAQCGHRNTDSATQLNKYLYLAPSYGREFSL